ncbi:unnamed protein product [Heterosigma akashiwo]
MGFVSEEILPSEFLPLEVPLEVQSARKLQLFVLHLDASQPISFVMPNFEEDEENLRTQAAPC